MRINVNEYKSMVVQVMAWCHGATAITSTKVDNDNDMVSIGHNELME